MQIDNRDENVLQKFVSLSLVSRGEGVQVAIFETNSIFGRLASQNIQQSGFLAKRIESGFFSVARDKSEWLGQKIS